MSKRTLSEMQEKEDMIEEIKRLNIELKDFKDNYEPKIIFREINQNNKALVALEQGRVDKRLIYNDKLDEYTGFYDFRNIHMFNFLNLFNNRVVNSDVIDNRVKENLENYEKYEKLLNFGTIKLAIINDDTEENNNTFWIMDGQHRIEVAKKLALESIINNDEITVNVTIKILDNQEEMNNYLKLYQMQYPPDMRLFSTNKIERDIKDFLIKEFRRLYPEQFKHYDKYIKQTVNNLHSESIDDEKKSTGLYNRTFERAPNLSDPIVADLYKKINIFRKISDDGEPYIIKNPDIIEKINRMFNHNKICNYGYIYKKSNDLYTINNQIK